MIQKFFLITILGIALTNALIPTAEIQGSLLNTLEKNGKANIVISFKQDTQPILENVNGKSFETRGHKITSMKTQLEQLAKESQQGVVSILKSRSSPVKFQSFWINNKIIVKNATLELIQTIADNPDVREIREELVAHIKDTVEKSNPASTSQEEVSWGVGKIEADQAWNLVGGNHGEGVVVALKGNWRADGYGWFDAHTRSRNPNDVQGHGTNAIGVAVGSNGIGVAPGAQWVSCRGCGNNYYDGLVLCWEEDLLLCGEWILCPTQWNTQNPDCSKAPNLVSNSWNCGGSGNYFYTEVVDAWKAASIFSVFPAGDGGPTCSSVESPADYEGVIGVGATTQSDGIVSSSCRGPSIAGVLKPDLTAPALTIRTACRDEDTSYCNAAGTGMASPHVAGTAAMLLARNPDLTFDQIKDLLQNNTDREVEGAESCGGTNSTHDWPNNVYGYGRINARKALASLIGGSS
ncbi:Bacillopeptidase F [Orchesella cincta]|uniref:Bacillopeptidase F n=1 Tax=Orchesella cincta TaxID=48709 RepID=A0A1D2MGF1_ORCCI|nr:Bacillopeptidase F [Orchesella cincta]